LRWDACTTEIFLFFLAWECTNSIKGAHDVR
jgi:hypothetical protein